MQLKRVDQLTNESDRCIELLLYFPAKKQGQSTLGAMWKVGRVNDFPHRVPSHWALLPSEPVEPTLVTKSN